MIHRLFTTGAALAALAFAVQPLAAQPVGHDHGPGGPEGLAALGKMFPVEPLTAEQQARVPQAQRIVELLIPDGTLAEMMGKTFDRMLGPILAKGDDAGMATITKATGFAPHALTLDAAQTAELAVLFDPAYAERHKREVALVPEMMRSMMSSLEPTMRKAMSELYAINFTSAQLTEIEAFFRTPTGAAYARKSFAMSSDPRVMAASMQAVPQMMAGFEAMEKKAKEATADLPPERKFTDLAPAEKAKVAQLTGHSVEDIEAQLAARHHPS